MTRGRLSLQAATDKFFRLHWCKSALLGPAPTWFTWNLKGIPEAARKGGCYAIFEGSRLLYVGSAVTEGKRSKVTGKKYGLLNRLRRHVLQPNARGASTFVPLERKPQWKRISAIRLIAFEDEYRYLAAALERFLIRELHPEHNAESRWKSEVDGA